MAQNTVLASGATAATSTDIVVAAGAVVTVGIFVASGTLDANMEASLNVDTPGVDIQHRKLNGANPVTVISGPCTARVYRPPGKTFGVYTET